jgi:glycosyltransferase involved in cell wall biosynthesis
MGLPVVGTALPGIAEIVSNPSLGLLFSERAAGPFADALAQALDASWDRECILAAGQCRTWQGVSERLAPIFAAAALRA